MWFWPSHKLYNLCNIMMIQNHLFHSFIFLEFLEDARNICHPSVIEDVPSCLDFSKTERCWSHVSQFRRVNLTILLKYSVTQSSSSKDGISLCCLNSVTPEKVLSRKVKAKKVQSTSDPFWDPHHTPLLSHHTYSIHQQGRILLTFPLAVHILLRALHILLLSTSLSFNSSQALA